MAEQLGRPGAPTGAQLARQLTHNLLLAASRLAEPYRAIYERLYLQGQKESVVCRDLQISSQELEQRKSTMLRMLHSATTT